jgi:hypothetical protein
MPRSDEVIDLADVVRTVGLATRRSTSCATTPARARASGWETVRFSPKERAETLLGTPMLFRTPSGYVQRSPCLGLINKQLELIGRYLVELGMAPASRSRVMADTGTATRSTVSSESMETRRVIVTPGQDDAPRDREVYDRWLMKRCGAT